MSNITTTASEVETYWAKFGLSTVSYRQQLEAYTLQIQDVALKTDLTSIEATAESIKQIKKLHTEMIELRKKATTPLDAVKERLMSFEKQFDPKSWEGFQKLEKTNLDLRLKAEAQAKAAAAKEQEKTDFRVFFEKEYIKQKENFSIEVGAFLQVAYEEALKAGVLPDMIELQQKLNSITPPKIAQYGNLKYLSREEATEIFKGISQPVLSVSPDLIQDKFSTFEIDLKRRDEAIKEAKEKVEADKQRLATQAQQQALVSQLTTVAATLTVETPKIKRSLAVELPNKPEEAQLIIATFLTNFTTLSAYLKVTKWENLTVKQMCETIGKYTTETGDEFAKIPYIDIVK